MHNASRSVFPGIFLPTIEIIWNVPFTNTRHWQLRNVPLEYIARAARFALTRKVHGTVHLSITKLNSDDIAPRARKRDSLRNNPSPLSMFRRFADARRSRKRFVRYPRVLPPLAFHSFLIRSFIFLKVRVRNTEFQRVECRHSILKNLRHSRRMGFTLLPSPFSFPPQSYRGFSVTLAHFRIINQKKKSSSKVFMGRLARFLYVPSELLSKIIYIAQRFFFILNCTGTESSNGRTVEGRMAIIGNFSNAHS